MDMMVFFETEKISTLQALFFKNISNYKKQIDDFQKIKKNEQKLTIGLFGYGVVGTGLYDVLHKK